MIVGQPLYKGKGAEPATELLDAQGKVLYKAEGRINAMELKKSIVNTLGRFIDKKK